MLSAKVMKVRRQIVVRQCLKTWVVQFVEQPNSSCLNSLDYAILTFSKNAVCSAMPMLLPRLNDAPMYTNVEFPLMTSMSDV